MSLRTTQSFTIPTTLARSRTSRRYLLPAAVTSPDPDRSEQLRRSSPPTTILYRRSTWNYDAGWIKERRDTSRHGTSDHLCRLDVQQQCVTLSFLSVPMPPLHVRLQYKATTIVTRHYSWSDAAANSLTRNATTVFTDSTCHIVGTMATHLVSSDLPASTSTPDFLRVTKELILAVSHYGQQYK